MKQSIKSFLSEDPSLKEFFEFELEQLQGWLKNANIRLNGVLEQIDELIDEDNNITDELAYDKLEFNRGYELGRIDTINSQIKSVQYKLRQID